MVVQWYDLVILSVFDFALGVVFIKLRR
jgi:hypothetical protein